MRFDSWEVVIFEERVEYEDAVAVCLVRPDIPAPFLIMDCCSMEMHRAWCYGHRGFAGVGCRAISSCFR